MKKWVPVAIVVVSLAATLPAVAQQRDTIDRASSGPSSSFRFTRGEIRQMQDEIRRVQQALITKGYHPGKVDAIAGPRTARALREFQRRQKIKATGRIDGSTIAALGVPRIGAQPAVAREGRPSTTGSR